MQAASCSGPFLRLSSALRQPSGPHSSWARASVVTLSSAGLSTGSNACPRTYVCRRSRAAALPMACSSADRDCGPGIGARSLNSTERILPPAKHQQRHGCQHHGRGRARYARVLRIGYADAGPDGHSPGRPRSRPWMMTLMTRLTLGKYRFG